MNRYLYPTHRLFASLQHDLSSHAQHSPSKKRSPSRIQRSKCSPRSTAVPCDSSSETVSKRCSLLQYMDNEKGQQQNRSKDLVPGKPRHGVVAAIFKARGKYGPFCLASTTISIFSCSKERVDHGGRLKFGKHGLTTKENRHHGASEYMCKDIYILGNRGFPGYLRAAAMFRHLRHK